MKRIYEAGEEDKDIRIDRFLSLRDPDNSRSFFQKLFSEGKITVSGRPVKQNFRLKSGDVILLDIPEPEETDILPEEIPLDILYEDEDIIVVNKPKGMVVHPAPGHMSGTLVNALLYHCRGNLSGINGELRPGIVHRIDRDTTGVLVSCKNDRAHRYLAEQLSRHSITRIYYCIVFGRVKEDGTVNAPIGRHPTDRKKMSTRAKNGREAITHYHILEQFDKYTMLECRLETGRTHQIRVHLSSIGHPLLGDTVYGPEKQPFTLEGQTLHAGVLGFIHPSTEKYVEFSAPLPGYFEELRKKLRK